MAGENTRKKKSPKIASASNAATPALAQQDVLDRETAITAVLEENGVKIKAMSRAVAALDRLIGNILEFPSVFIEPIINKKRSKILIDNELRQVVHDKAVEAAKKEPSLGNAYLDRFRVEQMEIDENRLRIASAAVDDLKQVLSEEELGGDELIDADWMSEFVNLAGRKSAPDIQLLWGRLLAGKIRNPGGNKLKTLYNLASLESNDVRRIHEFLLYSISNEFVVRVSQGLQSKLDFSEILFMEDIGVVSSSQITIANVISMKKNDEAIFILSGDVIKIECTDERAEVQLPMYPLAGFGKELAALIRFEPTPSNYILQIVEAIKNPSIKVWTAPLSINQEGTILMENDWTELWPGSV